MLDLDCEDVAFRAIVGRTVLEMDLENLTIEQLKSLVMYLSETVSELYTETDVLKRACTCSGN